MGPRHKIAIILPTLNEQDNIPLVARQLQEALAGFDYELIFCDGSSRDNSLDILKELNAKDSRIKYLYMSRNFGHQMALKAGLDHSNADAVVFMDCDMQHPPQVVPGLISRWQEGFDVVYTVRKESSHEPLLKRVASKLFYRVLNLFSEVPVIEGAADFILIDRKVAEILKKCRESPLFLRGMIAWMGFKQTHLEYVPFKRHAGKSKYGLRRLIEFAIDGITSFSTKPLRISVYFGGIVSAGAFLYLIYALFMRVFNNQLLSGWASLIASVLILGGVQLMLMGIIGEYLGKLFMSSKDRPNYIIQEKSPDLI